MPSIHIKILLPRDKGKPAAQCQEKFLQVVDQRLFQGRLIKVLIGREIKELQDIGSLMICSYSGFGSVV